MIAFPSLLVCRSLLTFFSIVCCPCYIEEACETILLSVRIIQVCYVIRNCGYRGSHELWLPW
jgi:hypothetical protein